MESELQPCSDDWGCDCSQCELYWEWMAEEELKLVGSKIAGREYDDEYEANRDETFEVDGW